MTLIIGNEVPGRVIMAADSAIGSPEESYVEPHLPKIALCGGDRYLVGACGSARAGSRGTCRSSSRRSASSRCRPNATMALSSRCRRRDQSSSRLREPPTEDPGGIC